MLIRKIFTKLKDIYLYIYLFLFKKILFTDKYGLSYYLYKNIRPIDTFRRGVRTDDTTVLVTVRELLQNNLHLKNIHCVDVGSFIGIVTLMMAKTLINSKNKWTIHSFEPFKDTFSKLKENIEIIYNTQII